MYGRSHDHIILKYGRGRSQIILKDGRCNDQIIILLKQVFSHIIMNEGRDQIIHGDR